MRHLTSTAVLALCLLLSIDAAAQSGEVRNENTDGAARVLAGVRSIAPGPGGRLLTVPDFEPGTDDRLLAPARAAGFAAQNTAPSRRRSPARVILGAVVGATGGFFAGGYTGAWIEGDRCHCDDPGLKGALIGAPIGAAVGGILGGLYLF